MLPLLKRSRALLMLPVLLLVASSMACSSNSDSTPPNTQVPDSSPTEPAGIVPAIEIKIGQGSIGSYLTDSEGRTLYVFLRDAPDTSNCTGGCLDVWPPLIQEDGSSVKSDASIKGAFSSIDTPSGKQVTFNQAPLYRYAPDAAPGDTTGHLVGNVWFVARPDTASTKAVGIRGSGEDAYLVGPTGMTLYLFAKDTAGVSNCNGQCLENWPALTLSEGLEPTAVSGAGEELALIARTDGANQVTYKGLPLYYYVGDAMPADTNGDGVGGVWSLATP